MTSWIVIDSGVLIASVLDESGTDTARALLNWIEQENYTIAAPTLILYELASSLRKTANRNTISPQDGENLLRQLLKRSLRVVVDKELIQQSYLLATTHGLPAAYDAQYLALAERLNLRFLDF